jgi:hypothetical protein
MYINNGKIDHYEVVRKRNSIKQPYLNGAGNIIRTTIINDKIMTKDK